MVSKEQDWKLRYFALTRTRSNIAASIDKIRTLCATFLVLFSNSVGMT